MCFSSFVQEEELLRQQEEQLALLKQLEENQRSVELQLQEAQWTRQRPEEALQVGYGTGGSESMLIFRNQGRLMGDM